jgi:hypothetical protein
MSESKAPKDPAYLATNNLPALLGVTGTFHILSWIFVILRVYTRVVLIKCFGKDDALMVLALVSTTYWSSVLAGCLHSYTRNSSSTLLAAWLHS